MPVVLIYRQQKLEVEDTLTVREALQKLGLSPESHLIVRNGELLNENDTLRNGDEVKIISAISGGNR